MAESNKQGTMGQATRKSMEHDHVLDTDKGKSAAQKKAIAGSDRAGETDKSGSGTDR